MINDKWMIVDSWMSDVILYQLCQCWSSKETFEARTPWWRGPDPTGTEPLPSLTLQKRRWSGGAKGCSKLVFDSFSCILFDSSSWKPMNEELHLFIDHCVTKSTNSGPWNIFQKSELVSRHSLEADWKKLSICLQNGTISTNSWHEY